MNSEGSEVFLILNRGIQRRLVNIEPNKAFSILNSGSSGGW